MIKLILIIGTGGFFGTVSRFLITRFLQNHLASSFPYGTFAVNIIGCFLIGIIYGFSERSNFMNPELRMFLAVGFCGGFTTFSTFANENVALLKDGNIFYVALYVSLSVFIGILATFSGNLFTKIF